MDMVVAESVGCSTCAAFFFQFSQTRYQSELFARPKALTLHRRLDALGGKRVARVALQKTQMAAVADAVDGALFQRRPVGTPLIGRVGGRVAVLVSSRVRHRVPVVCA